MFPADCVWLTRFCEVESREAQPTILLDLIASPGCLRMRQGLCRVHDQRFMAISMFMTKVRDKFLHGLRAKQPSSLLVSSNTDAG